MMSRLVWFHKKTQQVMAIIKASEVINGGIARPAPADVRFDAMLLSPHIADAEARFVVPILTEDFYGVLEAARSASASNYNPSLGATAQAFPSAAEYESLWTEHLREFCAVAVLYEALPFVGLQIQAGGLYLNDTSFGQNAGLQGIKFMQDTLLSKLEVKAERLKSWLCSCAASLDGFNPSATDYCPCSGGEILPGDVQKFHGILIY